VLIEFIAFELVGCAGAIGRRFAEAHFKWDAGCNLKFALGDNDHYDGRARSVTCVHHIHIGCSMLRGVGFSGFFKFFSCRRCCCASIAILGLCFRLSILWFS
jgi:hypothetical protein